MARTCIRCSNDDALYVSIGSEWLCQNCADVLYQQLREMLPFYFCSYDNSAVEIDWSDAIKLLACLKRDHNWQGWKMADNDVTNLDIVEWLKENRIADE